MTNRARAAALLAALSLALAGCGSAGSSDAAVDVSDSGFVAGDGSIVLLPEDERVPAPDLSGPTLDGGTFTLADHRGEVVVLNVWAS